MGSPPMPRSTLPGSLLAALLSLVAVTACSADASTRAGDEDAAPTTTAAAVELPDEVPPGTTLRVGDQLDYLQTVLELAGEDEDFPYEVEYSSFVGGPPMLQAFQGDALDTGFVGSTPLIFAQAAGPGHRGRRRLGRRGQRLQPGDRPRGRRHRRVGRPGRRKRVAYQRGTAAEAVLLQALDAAGIDPSDVTTVDLPLTQISAALQGGSADAGISVEPLTSVYLAANPTAAAVDDAAEITDRSSFVIATTETLDDPARSAALADYVSRLVRAFAYLQDHPDLIAQTVYVDQYGLTPERAAEIVEAQGGGAVVRRPTR